VTPAHEQAAASAAPRVSVIMIFLNAERFIKEAIESVFEQTFTAWELILVDDGSTDAGSEIARDAARRLPDKVRYVEHPGHQNLGMSASRNLGVREARGDYIAFLDADDVYLPERLGRHVDVLDAMPQVAMVQSNHIMWYSWAGEAEQDDDDFVCPAVNVGDRVLHAPQAMLTVLAAPWLGAGTASLTVRRDVVLAVGGFEPRFRDMYEDQVFTSKIYLEHCVYVLQDWLDKYRRHPGSWSRYLKDTGQFVDGLPHATTDAFHAWLRAYVQSRGIRQPLLEELLDNLGGKPGAPPKSGLAGRLRALIAPLVGRTKVAVERMLPKSLHRTLLRWDRRRRGDRLRRQYAALCDRMQAAELQRIALNGPR
jgi:glycosyltransferase involved in cell wall biosynthesis